ncbi:hypothetical protein Btru_072721 [Bulinus truncatus]|nr:hypothetical protein Btru_072721 [Bulinus truncatus]
MIEEMVPKMIEEMAPKMIEEMVPKMIEEMVPKMIEEMVPKMIEEMVPKMIEEMVPKMIEEMVPKMIEEMVPKMIEEMGGTSVTEFRRYLCPGLNCHARRDKAGESLYLVSTHSLHRAGESLYLVSTHSLHRAELTRSSSSNLINRVHDMELPGPKVPEHMVLLYNSWQTNISPASVSFPLASPYKNYGHVPGRRKIDRPVIGFYL